MGYFGGYGLYGGGGYSPPPPELSVPWPPFPPLPPVGPAQPYANLAAPSNDSFQPQSQQPHEKAEQPKEGGFKGFLKGMGEGVKEAFKTLVSPQGILMAAAFYGAKIWLGPPFVALALMAGIGYGTYKTLQGASQGDAEQAGKGFVTLLSSALFFVGGLKFNATLPGKSALINGEKYTLMSGQEGKAASFTDQLLSTLGMRKYQSSTGEEFSAYKLHRIRLKEWTGKVKNGYQKHKPGKPH